MPNKLDFYLKDEENNPNRWVLVLGWLLACFSLICEHETMTGSLRRVYFSHVFPTMAQKV